MCDEKDALSRTDETRWIQYRLHGHRGERILVDVFAGVGTGRRAVEIDPLRRRHRRLVHRHVVRHHRRLYRTHEALMRQRVRRTGVESFPHRARRDASMRAQVVHHLMAYRWRRLELVLHRRPSGEHQRPAGFRVAHANRCSAIYDENDQLKRDRART